ncbi:hypothetical protein K9L27_04595 [Candidatus Gracilibacteria bacterium]|nr:hypothetical protein [Candidatus Gracilibacteria bacterium]
MNYGKIIHDAWNLTTKCSKLKWLCFIPSFAAVLVFVLEIGWQGSLIIEEFQLFGIEGHFVYSKIGHFLSFLSQHHLLGWAIFAAVFIILFEFVFPSWISSATILAIRQGFSEPEKYVSLRQKLIEGSSHFFELFELHAFFSPFAMMTIAFFGVTMFRYYHGDIFSSIMLPVLIVYSLISLFLNVFIAFAPFFIVCEKRGIGEAVKRSIGLVFVNFGSTMTIILLMFLVNLRVIVNVLVVIGVPFGILFAVSFFAKSNWLSFAVVGAVLVGVVILALTAYLTAILEVFSTAVWERAFTILRIKEETLQTHALSPEEALTPQNDEEIA